MKTLLLDVNIHEKTDEPIACKFKKLIDDYKLKQHVIGPTHIKGHTIDVVITPDRDLSLIHI